MGVLAGLAVAGVAAGVMGGIAQSQQAAANNAAANTAWMEGEFQKGINNGKEIFNAVHNEQRQATNNRAIMKSAFLFQDRSKFALKQQTQFLQTQNSRQSHLAQGAINASRIPGGSGKAMMLAASLNALENTMQIEKNAKKQAQNIDGQFSQMMSQQSNNVYIANFQGKSAKPQQQDTVMPLIGGLVSGAAGGLSGYTGGVAAGF